ncbi:MAG: hypothetical protein NTX02_05820 [Planctomycetia bacterium]|nr:hypothetical protein [Planctomycetia bacterium]
MVRTDIHHVDEARMRRSIGIAFGVWTHILFGFTVWHLIWFLRGHAPSSSDAVPIDSETYFLASLAIDGILALIFALPHSVLLAPGVRKAVTHALVPGPFYGCFFCTMTCLALLFTIFSWQKSDVIVWEWVSPLDTCITVLFVASWAALLYSLHLSGLGYQTGWTPWWRWVRKLPPVDRQFAPRGAYLFLRHPVYLSFLGLIWFTPIVTLDRLVLIVVWSSYIFLGSVLKDRRLLFFLGDRYRSYQARVPGYPGMPIGPLARVPLATGDE